jgi:cytochrome bd-type quinol oxidase subunit 1
MKKILAISVLISSLLPVALLAQTEVQTLPTLPLIPTIDKVANLIFTILLALAVIFIIYAGVLFVTAAGSPEKVESARHILLYALIGIVIALLAKGVVWFIKGYLAP